MRIVTFEVQLSGQYKSACTGNLSLQASTSTQNKKGFAKAPVILPVATAMGSVDIPGCEVGVRIRAAGHCIRRATLGRSVMNLKKGFAMAPVIPPLAAGIG